MSVHVYSPENGNENLITCFTMLPFHPSDLKSNTKALVHNVLTLSKSQNLPKNERSQNFLSTYALYRPRYYESDGITTDLVKSLDLLVLLSLRDCPPENIVDSGTLLNLCALIGPTNIDIARGLAHRWFAYVGRENFAIIMASLRQDMANIVNRFDQLCEQPLTNPVEVGWYIKLLCDTLYTWSSFLSLSASVADFVVTHEEVADGAKLLDNIVVKFAIRSHQIYIPTLIQYLAGDEAMLAENILYFRNSLFSSLNITFNLIEFCYLNPLRSAVTKTGSKRTEFDHISSGLVNLVRALVLHAPLSGVAPGMYLGEMAQLFSLEDNFHHALSRAHSQGILDESQRAFVTSSIRKSTSIILSASAISKRTQPPKEAVQEDRAVKYQTELAQIKDIVPDFSDSAVLHALDMFNGDLEKALDRLMTHGDESAAVAAPPKPAPSIVRIDKKDDSHLSEELQRQTLAMVQAQYERDEKAKQEVEALLERYSGHMPPPKGKQPTVKSAAQQTLASASHKSRLAYDPLYEELDGHLLWSGALHSQYDDERDDAYDGVDANVDEVDDDSLEAFVEKGAHPILEGRKISLPSTIGSRKAGKAGTEADRLKAAPTTQRDARRKTENKARVANHNRKKAASRKIARVMGVMN